MRKQVWDFTVCCVMEGRARERAWKAALEYLAEMAAKGDLEYSGAELIEETDDEEEDDE